MRLFTPTVFLTVLGAVAALPGPQPITRENNGVQGSGLSGGSSGAKFLAREAEKIPAGTVANFWARGKQFQQGAPRSPLFTRDVQVKSPTPVVPAIQLFARNKRAQHDPALSASPRFWARDIKNTSVESAPNPIASLYPYSVTGTLNGTLTVIPIPLALARSIIPAKFAILTKAINAALPFFPKNAYPLVLRTCLDHDIQVAGIGIRLPDFQLTKLMFPFVDVLGDGYSSFTWINKTLINGNELIQNGILGYGQTPITATFQPFLEAYESVPATSTSRPVGISLVASVDKEPWLDVKLNNQHAQYSYSPYPLAFFKNVTNQPIVGNGSTCYQQINFFNTTLSTGAYAPVPVCGSVEIKAPLLPTSQKFKNVFGIQVDVAFLENNYMPCEQLKGYNGFEGM